LLITRLEADPGEGLEPSPGEVKIIKVKMIKKPLCSVTDTIGLMGKRRLTLPFSGHSRLERVEETADQLFYYA